MTKKIFVQPALTVVSICKNDILTTSTTTVGVLGTYNESTMTDLAPDRFDRYDEGY